MKIRKGFVSNSSTASFIVTFSANVSQEEIEQIIKLSDPNRSIRFSGLDFFESMRDEERDSWIIPLEKNMFGFYDVELSAVMFNDWMCVECWKFVRLLSEDKSTKLSLVQIVKTEEEYASCYELSSFDKWCWDSRNRDSDFADKRRQMDIEKEYEQYLKTLKERDLL